MGRNRRQQSAAIRFGPALKAVCLCLMIGGSAVGYVWQKDQLRQLSEQIVQSERRLAELRVANEKLRRQLNDLRSPPNVERLVQRLNLGLARPSPEQVVRLPEPFGLPRPAAGSGPVYYAAGDAERLEPHQ
jgi:cell division protein FtsB